MQCDRLLRYRIFNFKLILRNQFMYHVGLAKITYHVSIAVVAYEMYIRSEIKIRFRSEVHSNQ